VANSDYIKVHKVGQCAVCGVTLDLIEEYMEDQDTQKLRPLPQHEVIKILEANVMDFNV